MAEVDATAATSWYGGKGWEDKMKACEKAGLNEKHIKLSGAAGEGLFKLKGGQLSEVRCFNMFHGKVIAANWAPANSDDSMSNRIIAGDQSGQVLIINAKKGTRYGGYMLHGPSKFVQSAALTAKSQVAASGGMDNCISVYKEESADNPVWTPVVQWSRDEGHPETGHDGMISSLKFMDSDDNKLISCGGDGEVRIWDVASKKVSQVMYGHAAECAGISFPKDVPGAKVFSTASNDCTVRLWDVTSGKCTAVFKAPKAEDKLADSDMFPNGNAVAAGGQGQNTYLWDIRSGRLMADYTRNNMKITALSFSKSGRALLCTHEDGRIIVWDTFGETANQKYAIKQDAHYVPSEKGNPKSGAAPDSQITQLHLKPDGEFFLSAAFDGKAKIWAGLKFAA